MDTQGLRAFITVSETHSFSTAAEHLHLTQSAVSKRVAALEHQLGKRLFDRIGRQVRLTESGQRLLPRAHQILELMDDTRRSLQHEQHEITGRLTLGTSHHIGLHRLPPILRLFRQRYPSVQLDLRFLDSEDAYSGIKEGILELAVVTLAPNEDPRFAVMPLWRDRLCFVAGHDDPLCEEQPLTLATLSQHDAVLPNPLTFTRSLIMDRFTRAHLAPRVVMATHYLETLKMMASVGLGWSMLPETMVDDNVTRLTVDCPPIERWLGVLHHRDRTLSAAAQQMLALLKASGDSESGNNEIEGS